MTLSYPSNTLDVNLRKKRAEVETEVEDAVLVKAVEEAGYTVKKIK